MTKGKVLEGGFQSGRSNLNICFHCSNIATHGRVNCGRRSHLYFVCAAVSAGLRPSLLTLEGTVGEPCHRSPHAMLKLGKLLEHAVSVRVYSLIALP